MKGCPSSSNVALSNLPFPTALSSSPRTRLTIREFLNVETYRFTASSARSSNVKNVVIFGALFPSLPLPCSLFFVISVSPFVLLPVSSGVARAPYRNERDVPPTGAGNRCAFVPLPARPRSPPHAESADAGTRPDGPYPTSAGRWDSAARGPSGYPKDPQTPRTIPGPVPHSSER